MIRDDSAFQPQDLITATAVTSATTNVTADSYESLKREALNMKVRTENRERKKRWREANEDRNKDNDLRCRVNKRANKLFGKDESEHKARWIEEEFGKRQLKRKEKERRRNPNGGSVEPLPEPPKSTLSLNEHLALHQQAQAQMVHHQVQQTIAAHPQFDPNTVKTALALNDLVKKNGNHLDLAELTGVLTDPDLARQLIEIEANNPAPSPSAAMMMLSAPAKADHEIKTTHMLEADYPMDAVLTLMQLNGSWKA